MCKFWKASFSTFAWTVIRNHLVSRCRSAVKRNTHEAPGDEPDTVEKLLANIRGPDDETKPEVVELLENAKAVCTEQEKPGVDFLWRKAMGYTATEIAEQNGLTANQVNKRMAKVREKLRQSPEFFRAVK